MFLFREINKLVIDDMQAFDDHEDLRSRSYMIVELGLLVYVRKSYLHIYTYANMYMLIAVCTICLNLLFACLYAFLMYAFLEDVWFSSVLKWRLCLNNSLDL